MLLLWKVSTLLLVDSLTNSCYMKGIDHYHSDGPFRIPSLPLLLMLFGQRYWLLKLYRSENESGGGLSRAPVNMGDPSDVLRFRHQGWHTDIMMLVAQAKVQRRAFNIDRY